jgi:hypothetical protein
VYMVAILPYDYIQNFVLYDIHIEFWRLVVEDYTIFRGKSCELYTSFSC